MHWRTAAKIVMVPLIYGLVMRLIYGIDSLGKLYGVMTLGFLIMVPLVMGMLTVYLSPPHLADKLLYRNLAPWGMVTLFLIVTLLLDWEGWACWMIVFPAFGIVAEIGGLLGHELQLRQRNRNVSFIALFLLPFIISPIEKSLPKSQGEFEARTFIDIKADPATIWSHVTRVKEISAREDRGKLTNFLQFPRPVKAELDTAAVGGYREAIFTKGLVFHETVLEYQDRKKMVFSITANPYEIPSATMDKHVVVGGEFFNVLNGTYEMEQLPDGKQRLHLYSHFSLSTTFNWYAGLWARWIMLDIQNNILEVIKSRTDSGF